MSDGTTDGAATPVKLLVRLADLERVCGTAAAEATRAGKNPIFDRPWRAGGYAWACNGRVLVRVPDYLVTGVENGKTPSKIVDLPWSDCLGGVQPWTWQAMPLAPATLAMAVECTACQGVKQVRPCLTCKGMMPPEGCPACRGYGWVPEPERMPAVVPCQRCAGLGAVERQTRVELRPTPRQRGTLVYLAARDVRLARTLPGPLKVRYPDHAYQAQVPFGFAGGAGEGWMKLA